MSLQNIMGPTGGSEVQRALFMVRGKMKADGNAVASVLAHPEMGLAREAVMRALRAPMPLALGFQSLLAGPTIRTSRPKPPAGAVCSWNTWALGPTGGPILRTLNAVPPASGVSQNQFWGCRFAAMSCKTEL
jgi:hypothetical protein